MKNLVLTVVALASVSAFASTDYKCTGVKDNTYEGSIKVTVMSATEVKVNDVDLGTFDETYKPRGGNVKYARMSGFYKSLGDGVEGYNATLLVSKTMLNGANSGSIKLSFSGEGFFSNHFTCRK